MAKLHFDLVSPERHLISADVDQVDVPGSEGDFGVFAGHAPVMTTLRPGVLAIQTAGRAAEKFFVRGGFAEVSEKGLTVLAEDAVDLANVDPARLEQDLKNAQEDLRDATSDEKRATAQRALSRLEALQAALSR